jgi:hypothetical protein
MELVFLMVVLKIPIVYLCVVVYRAIKAEPHRGEPEAVRVRTTPDAPQPGWGRRPRRRPSRPHGGPGRGYARTSRAAYARPDRQHR